MTVTWRDCPGAEVQMIHKNDDGTFVISSRNVWLPGCYDCANTARRAFRHPDDVLKRLQDAANARTGGAGGVITGADLDGLKVNA